MIKAAQHSLVEEVALTVRELLKDVVKTREMEGFVRESDARDMLEEEQCAQLMLIAGSLRESLADVLKKEDVKEMKKRLIVGHRALELRVTSLETGAADRKEGLRRRIDKIDSKVRELEGRLEDFDNCVDEQEVPGGSGSIWCDRKGPEVELQRFRERLAVNMPVHLRGLSSRGDLSGKAGILLQ